MSKETTLPTLADLTKDTALAYKNDKFNELVNQSPPEKWVKVHPYIKGHKYLPIDKIEFLLKRIFKRYRIEVLDIKTLLNSICCHVRVHYQHPVSGEWEYHDGVGSAELQTQQDSGALRVDASNINRGAVPMATGIAKTVAIKDACDHIGDLFGANLNRKDITPFSTDNSLKKYESARVVKLIDGCDTVEKLNALKDTVPADYHDLIDDKINYLEEADATD